MQRLVELVLLLIVLTNFMVLGTSRLSTCIRAIAFQGLLLGLLPPLLHRSLAVYTVALALSAIAVKAIILPRFLQWAIREASVRREIEPRIGFVASLLLGAVAVAVAFGTAQQLPLPDRGGSLAVAVSLATVICGLIVLTSRARALTQVVGYLMLENGVYLFGLTQAARVPFLVELGMLLDVFVGVFIMGIVVFHINREFDSLSDTDLTELSER
ncbi:MAG: hydrogenase [Gemmatimonadetes bacterium]|nr:hydrogenase [Gemmatimonadota bacterium]